MLKAVNDTMPQLFTLVVGAQYGDYEYELRTGVQSRVRVGVRSMSVNMIIEVLRDCVWCL